ncbi:hypothetical protein HNR42_000185 [Deinobacterium chartae]|uniref:Uncharacterized protein n=1 Tax=Deinobacterium chartae TaxID=521158 RepID=A0A841HVB8_9DEIO|nr:hypothetical protein [Deinobacterium chartae]MBB6096773.1 hypothetical protein [Deinobacterium chartae]
MSELLIPALIPAATENDPRLRRAYALAGTAVAASKLSRPTLRLARLGLEEGARYHTPALPAALRQNRAFLEDNVMAELAAVAAEQIKFGAALTDMAPMRRTLEQAAANADEAEATQAYLEVLLARARGLLRRCWAEVEIVAMALQEHRVLEGSEVEHRIRCAQGIRSNTLN